MKDFFSLLGLVLMHFTMGSYLSFSATPSSAGFQVSSWTVDGGGGVSSGGGFEIAGTIGQPDSAPQLSGGCWSVDPGFWDEYTVLTMPGAPRLRIRLLDAGTVLVSFSPGCGDWVLQYTILLGEIDPTSIRWSDDAASNLFLVDDEMTRSFHIPSWGERLFVRLRQR